MRRPRRIKCRRRPRRRIAVISRRSFPENKRAEGVAATGLHEAVDAAANPAPVALKPKG
jgi:hypothetical protein